MTDSFFALLLAGVPRHDSYDIMMSLDGHALQPRQEGNWVRHADVLTALAAAYPADLAEAGKVLEEFAMSARIWTKAAEHTAAPTFSRGDCRAWAERFTKANDLITALLARIAAQEAADRAQVEVIEKQADTIIRINARAETALAASEAKVAELTKELETARLATGLVRLCVNCGKTRPADYGAVTPREGCPSPDACTWDMTPQEAADHWRKIAHDRYTSLTAERAKVAKLVEAGQRVLDAPLDTMEEHNAVTDLRAAITEASQ